MTHPPRHLALHNKFTSLFKIMKKTQIQCSHCKQFSESKETVLTSLPVPLICGENCSIQSSIQSVLGPVLLTQSNQYYCAVCQGLQDACLYTSIIQYPMVFVVFLQTMAVPSNFTTTEELEIGDDSQSNNYQLTSFSLFQGEDSKGHYISMIRDQRCWNAYSDEKYIPVQLEDWRSLHTKFLSSSLKPFRPYLLFYKRLSVRKKIREMTRTETINPLDTPVPARSLSLSRYVKVNIPSFPTFTNALTVELPRTDLAVHPNSEEKMNKYDSSRWTCACPVCGKAFTRRSSFVRHRKIHSGNRPLKCSCWGCNQSFYRMDKLIEHEASHLPKLSDLRIDFENHGGRLPGVKRVGGWENWDWDKKRGGEGWRENAGE